MSDQLIGAGLVIGMAIGIVLLVKSTKEKSRTGVALAALLLVAVAAIILIVSSWTASPTTRPWLETAEFALMIISGPLAVAVVAALLRRSVPTVKVVAIAAAAFSAAQFITLLYGGDPVRLAVPVQSAFVVYGWLLFVGDPAPPRRLPRARRHRAVAAGLLASLTLANCASVVRLVFADVAWLRQLVPLTISSLIILLLLALLWSLFDRGARLVGGFEAASEETALLATEAAAVVEQNQLYRQPDLRIQAVAERLGTPPARLAAALAASRWGSFAGMVQVVRVEAVRRMLSDRRERRTSIEAIGMLCGFRSRSALYEAFQRQIGTTPGEYRRKSCPNS